MINECVYYKGSSYDILGVYMDDGLFFTPTDKEINTAIADIRVAGYDISNKGEIDGVKIEHVGPSIRLTQPHLITQLLQDTGLEHAKHGRHNSRSGVLPIGQECRWSPAQHYRSVIGKLNFLEKQVNSP